MCLQLSVLIYQVSQSCCYIATNIIEQFKICWSSILYSGKIFFLYAFAKLRKATISFVMSVCLSVFLSVHPPARDISAPTGRIFTKLDISLFFFVKFVEKSQGFYYNRTRIKTTLREDQYTSSIISRSILLRIKNVSDKSCRETRNTHFMFNKIFFSKIVPFVR
jgi:hypothetical protein